MLVWDEQSIVERAVNKSKLWIYSRRFEARI